MGAPIIIDDCMDLWVSNGVKDYFCEIIVNGAALRGLDVSAVYENAPGIAGTFGVSGVGIDADEFYLYFGGREGFREHLDFCSNRMEELCDGDERSTATMQRVFAWAKYKMDGGALDDSKDDFAGSWPPGYSGK
ncbi:hypothetical protein [Duganella sp. HH101]|uniref:hypothetical protein n=1 Tax=Duganella sp. HH101 TaxID=1781066 RepID=UPI00114CE773|nr:hypothetical protein [Duganella sp. HH101]